MTAKTVIRDHINQCRFIVSEYISDLSDADLLVRPAAGANHTAWQLGHLIASANDMLSQIGVRMPELPAGFAAAHDRDAVAVDDASKFGKLTQYRDLLKRQLAAVLAHLDARPDAELDQAGPESMRSYAPTVAAVYMMFGTHELMHAGQFAVVRRKLGKPIKI